MHCIAVNQVHFLSIIHFRATCCDRSAAVINATESVPIFNGAAVNTTPIYEFMGFWYGQSFDFVVEIYNYILLLPFLGAKKQTVSTFLLL